jgi:ketosteroid isomerase-like protein
LPQNGAGYIPREAPANRGVSTDQSVTPAIRDVDAITATVSDDVVFHNIAAGERIEGAAAFQPMSQIGHSMAGGEEVPRFVTGVD